MIHTSKLFEEVSPLSSKDCFILIERRKSNFNFPVHIHPEFELNYIENAKGAQRIVGDSVEVIGQEELVLIANTKLEHAWIDHECQSDDIHEITIQFHHNLLSDSILGRNQMLSIAGLLKKASRGVVFSERAISRVRPMIKMLMSETDSFYSLMKFFIILHELSKDEDMRVLSNLFLSSEKQDSTMGSIVDYLQKHYSEVVRLSDVANYVNMSEISFSRYMKQHTSKSFVDFLNDMRLSEAVRLLIDGTDSVAEICYTCGFNNLSNFNRIFKKKKGVTPSEFRENYRKNRIIV